MEYIVRQTEAFAAWRARIKNLKAATAIRRRMERIQAGNLGDVKPVGGGVSELRIDVGAGYRLYFTTRKTTIIFLLVGGTKSTQKVDIANAIAMTKEIET